MGDPNMPWMRSIVWLIFIVVALVTFSAVINSQWNKRFQYLNDKSESYRVALYERRENLELLAFEPQDVIILQRQILQEHLDNFTEYYPGMTPSWNWTPATRRNQLVCQRTMQAYQEEVLFWVEYVDSLLTD
jgi:hypothetical protein